MYQLAFYSAAIRISIHAPAWGATLPEVSFWRLRTISIHAPAWGTTNFIGGSFVNGSISIHAPRMGSDERTSSRRNYR